MTNHLISDVQIGYLLRHGKLLLDQKEMLQTLPELTGEPVAWLAQWHIEPTHYSEADGGLELVEPSAEGAFAVYTHAQPLHAITADDVTDEMLQTLDGYDFINYAEPKALVAATINAFIKHRGDTK